MSRGRCVAPLDSEPDGPVCERDATTTRVVDDVICALCAEHAAELDDEQPPPTARQGQIESKS